MERRLEEEQTRVLQYLDPSTRSNMNFNRKVIPNEPLNEPLLCFRKPLIANAENELLTKHIDTVLTKGFV